MKKLKLALNPDLINRNEAGDNRLYAEGFVNTEATLDEIIEAVRHGWAFCAHISGPRSATNFLASDVAAVDVDETPSIEAILQHPLVEECAGFVYTTVSHTPDAPRLRVVFPLARTITDRLEYTALLRSLTLRLSGDPSATDAARISFGSRGAQTWVVGRSIPMDLLDELILQSIDIVKTKARCLGQPAAVRAQLHVPQHQEVQLASSITQTLSGTAPKTPVYCPFHDDRHPSAFVVMSQRGVKGIHCSACAQTYWPPSVCNEDYDFNSFEYSVREAKEFFERHKDWGPFYSSAAVNPGLSECDIDLVSGSPAPTVLKPGLTFIKSPKGSGKTRALEGLLRGQKSVLLIGHRRSLIRQSCDQLQLACYLDREIGGTRHFWFGVCLDSLTIVSPTMHYDVLVLDEAEQLLGHFLSETLEKREGGGRDRLFFEFRHRVRQAKSVIALDADLGWASFSTLTRRASVPD